MSFALSCALETFVAADVRFAASDLVGAVDADGFVFGLGGNAGFEVLPLSVADDDDSLGLALIAGLLVLVVVLLSSRDVAAPTAASEMLTAAAFCKNLSKLPSSLKIYNIERQASVLRNVKTKEMSTLAFHNYFLKKYLQKAI